MELYDFLPDSRIRDRSIQRWRKEAGVRAGAEAIEIDVLGHGQVDHESIRNILKVFDDRDLFTLLLGLDGALDNVNVSAVPIEECSLQRIATRYAQTGFLNDPAAVPGMLLPRCSYPARPRGEEQKADFFRVHFVPPGAGLDLLDYRRVRRHSVAPLDPEYPAPVGCAPLLATYDELEVAIDLDVDPAAYRLSPAPLGPTVVDRMRTIIGAMDEGGVRIGVMPEGCLSEEIVEKWQAVARETSQPESTLDYLLIGSGPVGGHNPPFNRAVLIHRHSGQILMTHDKMHRFTIDREMAAKWKIPGAPGDRWLEEDIATGDRLGILDLGRVRLAVLICEDLSSSFAFDREIAAVGVSTLLVPIFARPIRPHHWETSGAQRLVNMTGSWIVVANSLVVTGDDGHTCLVAGPGDPDRETHDVRLQYGTATSAKDISLVATKDGPVLPTILGGGGRLGWRGHEA
ncbi:hypothetical protein [Actinoplanes sp. NPDC051411]|uniref:hypothetical protein n=1 Tax=Actinoplanes sp. NPDC051411 TaxID=3155522 RepID=UPI003426247C